MNSKELLPTTMGAVQIVRVPNGWVIYDEPYGIDIRNGCSRAPRAVFESIEGVRSAIYCWGSAIEEEKK